MNKLYSKLVIAFLFLFLLNGNILSKNVNAQNDQKNFFIENGILKSYRGSETDIFIPNGVTSISNDVFSENLNISSVIIPEGVQTIGKGAFRSCSNLRQVHLPNTLVAIGDAAFYHCTNLTDIILPKNITAIGTEAFAYCSSLSSITIPGSICAIPQGMMSECINLESVIIEPGVKTISYYAFDNCTNLKSLVIPSSVTTMMTYPSNDNLIIYGAENSFIQEYASIRNIPFEIDPSQPAANYQPQAENKDFDFGLFSELQSYEGHESTVMLPEKTLKVSGFHNLWAQQVIISDSVISILDSAFRDCMSLETLVVGKGVLCIEDYAFSNCNKLKEVFIPANVIEIGENIFFFSGDDHDIVVYGVPNSYAEIYCKNNNITFSSEIPEKIKQLIEGAYVTVDKETVMSGEISSSDIGHVIQNTDGTVYYWEYHSDSFASQATLSDYPLKSGIANRLIAVSPSGEKSAVLETEGGGILALSDNIVFYERIINDMPITCQIYSYDLETQETHFISDGKLKAVIGQNIIFSDHLETQLYCFHLTDSSVIKLADGYFLTTHDNCIYYQTPTEDITAAANGQVTLSVICADGSGQKNLCTTSPDLYTDDFATARRSFARIVFMLFRQDDIYFSYGSYSGTGEIFSGGRIVRVKKDGSFSEISAGATELQSPIFTLTEDNIVLSQSVIDQKISISPMDTYYIYNGSLYFFNDSGEAQELISPIDYASFSDIPCGYWSPDAMLTVNFAEKVGDFVYFLMDYSISDAYYAGWQRTYTRSSSAMFCKNLLTGQIETMFQY